MPYRDTHVIAWSQIKRAPGRASGVNRIRLPIRRMMRAFVPGQVELSVVVPALNEAENLPFLVQRIGAALRGRAYEVLVIDDGSTDRTAEVCEQLRERYP